jgi:hypothetical protein
MLSEEERVSICCKQRRCRWQSVWHQRQLLTILVALAPRHTVIHLLSIRVGRASSAYLRWKKTCHHPAMQYAVKINMEDDDESLRDER